MLSTPVTLAECASAIRILSIDAVEQAQSGHPGMPMGMADIATVLWQNHLRHNPNNPLWFNRDRFILSNGHGSLLLYSLLHLTGYEISLDDLKAFRQLDSRTPGHPEWGHTPGVETTTGPLGQGLANAVGMAMAEYLLANTFNRPGFSIIDHHTYAFIGDGCLMEGLSHEASSLAGTLKLGKLIVFYDDNRISIDGHVQGWFTENIPDRFRAYGWHVIDTVDGHNTAAIDQAITLAHAETDKPSLICCQTTIGYGCSTSYAGKASTHGTPLGEKEVSAVRKALNWPWPAFTIPETIQSAWDQRLKGKLWEDTWQSLFNRYAEHYPQEASECLRRLNGQIPDLWPITYQTCLQTYVNNPSSSMATRKASQICLTAYTQVLPELLGGSADLSESNNTLTSISIPWIPSEIAKNTNYIHYGVREFAMAAIMNGLALHGGFIPFGGTFLIFSDYARSAIRLSALMKQRVIYVLTHDSIGLGEDGPTHQPVEQITSLRLIPNLAVWRPCDQVETAVAWQSAITCSDGPTALLLSRQALPNQNHTLASIADIERGGYILIDSTQAPEIILIATGSEVQLAVQACQQLHAQGWAVRVVSMPCPTLFKKQDQAYQNRILPPKVRHRMAIEAGSSLYWYPWVGTEGKVLGLDHFGASAPGPVLFETFGFTVENLINMLFSGEIAHVAYNNCD